VEIVSAADRILEKLTIKDIELMITILQRFIYAAKRAERMLSRLQSTQTSISLRRPEDIMGWIMQQSLAQKQAAIQPEVEEEDKISEEEEKQIEQLLEKIRTGKAKEIV